MAKVIRRSRLTRKLVRESKLRKLSSSKSGRRLRKQLTDDDLKKICNYLENPTKTGIWTLKAKWLEFEGISEFVIKKLRNIFENKGYIEVTSGKRKIKINLKTIDQEELLSITKRLTFVFNLFTYLYHVEKQDETFNTYLEMEGTQDKLIFDIIDLDEIKEKYSDAFTYFKQNIYFEDFSPTVRENKIIKIKNGFLLLSWESSEYPRHEETHFEEREPRDISLISINSEPLETLKIFYEKLDKLKDASLLPVYSPEEEVFEPYFSLLEHAYEYFIDNQNIKRLFSKSISEYNEDNYPNCISTIGLIAEDYLIQIYETFFRDISPKGLTLGQVYDHIHNTIRKRYEAPLSKEPHIKPIYDSISKLLEKSPPDRDPQSTEDILKTMRDIVTYIKDDKKHTKNIIDSMQKKKQVLSIFTPRLTQNINELIKNRNATSHKSRVPIGNYEALRSVYCCITLILWLNNEKRLIDWKETPEEILRKTIERNSSITLV